jgi:hypothetical protein
MNQNLGGSGNLYRGPSKDVSYQVSIHLEKAVSEKIF